MNSARQVLPRSFMTGKKTHTCQSLLRLGARARTSIDQVYGLHRPHPSARLPSSQVTQVFDFLSKKTVPHGLYPIRINPDTGRFSGTKVCKKHPSSIRRLSTHTTGICARHYTCKSAWTLKRVTFSLSNPVYFAPACRRESVGDFFATALSHLSPSTWINPQW